MVLERKLGRRVALRHDDEESEDIEEQTESSSGGESSNIDADGDESTDSEGSTDSNLEDDEDGDKLKESLAEISFGALARAQETSGFRKRELKRKRNDEDEDKKPLDDMRDQIRKKKEEKSSSSKNKDFSESSTRREKRSSKHAPTIQSSKYAVTRRRTVVDGLSLSQTPARDPRFDPSTTHSASTSSSSYAFLSTYRASELTELRNSLRRTKDPEAREAISATLRSLADRQRTMERRQAEKDVVAAHRAKEREMIRDGRKTRGWFMKRAEVRKEVVRERFEAMGAGERRKQMERKRRRVAGRERGRGDVPRERRTNANSTAE